METEMLKVHALLDGSYSVGVIAKDYLDKSSLMACADMVAIEDSDGVIDVRKNRDGVVGVCTIEELEKMICEYC